MSKLFGAKEKPSIGVCVKDLQGAVCSGFLYKRGPKPTASYVRKFVVIHSGRVFYFNSPEPDTPARGFLELGKFRLGAILTGTTHDIPILTVPGLSPSDREYHFRAETGQERGLWIQVLQRFLFNPAQLQPQPAASPVVQIPTTGASAQPMSVAANYNANTIMSAAPAKAMVDPNDLESIMAMVNANLKDADAGRPRASTIMSAPPQFLNMSFTAPQMVTTTPTISPDQVEKQRLEAEQSRLQADAAAKQRAEELARLEAQRQAEQARYAEQQRVAQMARLAEQQRQAEAAKLAEQQRAEEQRQAEAARLADQQRQAEIARIAEQQRQAEAARLAEQQRQAEAARLAEQMRQAEAARLAEQRMEQQRQAEAARVAEQQRQAEIARIAEQQRQAEAARHAEQQRQIEAARLAEQQRQAEAAQLAEQQRQAAEAHIAEQQTLNAARLAEQQQAAQVPTQQSGTPLPSTGLLANTPMTMMMMVPGPDGNMVMQPMVMTVNAQGQPIMQPAASVLPPEQLAALQQAMASMTPTQPPQTVLLPQQLPPSSPSAQSQTSAPLPQQPPPPAPQVASTPSRPTSTQVPQGASDPVVPMRRRGDATGWNIRPSGMYSPVNPEAGSSATTALNLATASPSSSMPAASPPPPPVADNIISPRTSERKGEPIKIFFVDATQKTILFEFNKTFTELRELLQSKMQSVFGDMTDWGFYAVLANGTQVRDIPNNVSVQSIVGVWADIRDTETNRLLFQPIDAAKREKYLPQLAGSRASMASKNKENKKKAKAGVAYADVVKNALRTGTLEKKGDDVVGSFKSRHFVLEKDTLKMWYFSSQEDDATPKGFIQVNACKLIKAAKYRSYCFVLHHSASGRDYILAAPNDSERTAWIQALTPHVEEVVSGEPSSRPSAPAPVQKQVDPVSPRKSEKSALKDVAAAIAAPLPTKVEMKEVQKTLDTFESEGPKLVHLTAGRAKPGAAGRKPPSKPGRAGLAARAAIMNDDAAGASSNGSQFAAMFGGSDSPTPSDPYHNSSSSFDDGSSTDESSISDYGLHKAPIGVASASPLGSSSGDLRRSLKTSPSNEDAPEPEPGAGYRTSAGYAGPPKALGATAHTPKGVPGGVPKASPPKVGSPAPAKKMPPPAPAGGAPVPSASPNFVRPVSSEVNSQMQQGNLETTTNDDRFAIPSRNSLGMRPGPPPGGPKKSLAMRPGPPGSGGPHSKAPPPNPKGPVGAPPKFGSVPKQADYVAEDYGSAPGAVFDNQGNQPRPSGPPSNPPPAGPSPSGRPPSGPPSGPKKMPLGPRYF